jgi:hypothetical protein
MRTCVWPSDYYQLTLFLGLNNSDIHHIRLADKLGSNYQIFYGDYMSMFVVSFGKQWSDLHGFLTKVRRLSHDDWKWMLNKLGKGLYDLQMDVPDSMSPLEAFEYTVVPTHPLCINSSPTVFNDSEEAIKKKAFAVLEDVFKRRSHFFIS